MGWFSDEWHILRVFFVNEFKPTFFILGEGDNGLREKVNIIMQFANPDTSFISVNFFIPKTGWDSTRINRNLITSYDFEVVNKL